MTQIADSDRNEGDNALDALESTVRWFLIDAYGYFKDASARAAYDTIRAALAERESLREALEQIKHTTTSCPPAMPDCGGDLATDGVRVWCSDHKQTARQANEYKAALQELRCRLHAQGRRPEECMEMSLIDDALATDQ